MSLCQYNVVMHRTQHSYGTLCSSKNTFSASIALASIFGILSRPRYPVPNTANQPTFAQPRKLSVGQCSLQLYGKFRPETSLIADFGSKGAVKTGDCNIVDNGRKKRDYWRSGRRFKQDAQNHRASSESGLLGSSRRRVHTDIPGRLPQEHQTRSISDACRDNTFTVTPSRVEDSIYHDEISANTSQGDQHLQDSVMKDEYPEEYITRDHVPLNTMTESRVIREDLLHKEDVRELSAHIRTARAEDKQPGPNQDEVSNEDATREFAKDTPVSKEALVRDNSVSDTDGVGFRSMAYRHIYQPHIGSIHSPALLDSQQPATLNQDQAAKASSEGQHTAIASSFFDALNQMKQLSEGFDTEDVPIPLRSRIRPASFNPVDVRSSADMPPQKNANTERLVQSAINVDYEGVYIPLKDESEDSDNDVPWVDRNCTKELSTRARFNAEILGFEKWFALSEVEQRGRTHLVRDVLSMILRSKSSYGLAPSGSSENGLASVTSDLDFRWFDREFREHGHHWSDDKKRRAKRAKIRRLQKIFEKRADFSTVSAQYIGRSPLLTIRHRDTGIKLRIEMTDVRKQLWVSHYQDTYPAIRQVYFVVKAALESRGLTDVSRGGIGGYSIFGMVAAVFRLFPDISKGDAVSRLTAFLEFYANFDTVKYGIDMTIPEIFAKTQPPPSSGPDEVQKDVGDADVLDSVEDHKSNEAQKEAANLSEQKATDSENIGSDVAVEDGPRHPSSLEDSSVSRSHETNFQSSYGAPDKKEISPGRDLVGSTNIRRPYLLYLQNPSSPRNNLGSKSFAIKHIIATFRHLHRIVLTSIEDDLPTLVSTVGNGGVGGVRNSIATGYDSLLQPFVGTAFSSSVESKRQQLKSWYEDHVIRQEGYPSHQHHKDTVDHDAKSSCQKNSTISVRRIISKHRLHLVRQ
ncbi:MAG: hypothetical protein Q9165_003910 [Trypethelium subeluteriae]